MCRSDRTSRGDFNFPKDEDSPRKDEAQGGSPGRQCETSPRHPTNRTDGISLPRARNTRVTRVDVYNPARPDIRDVLVALFSSRQCSRDARACTDLPCGADQLSKIGRERF
jgi:hypothetical protein